jgi:hypothetical protein
MKTVSLTIEVLEYLSRLPSLKNLMLNQRDLLSVSLEQDEFLTCVEKELVLDFWPQLDSGKIKVFSEYYKSWISYSFDELQGTLSVKSNFRKPIKYSIGTTDKSFW